MIELTGLATSLNEHGQVVVRTDGDRRAYIRNLDGSRIDLVPPAGVTSYVPADMNDRGDVVARTLVPEDRAILFSGGSARDLGIDRAYDFTINNRGDIAGTREFGSIMFLYRDGVMRDLGTGEEVGVRLNDNGDILIPRLVDKEPRAVLIKVDGSTELVPEMGLLNTAGQVVFSRRVGSSFSFRGFLFEDGTTVDLGLLPGTDSTAPTAMNNRGDVVGHAATRAFFWRDGTMQEIPGGGGDIFALPQDVNEHARVVGKRGDRAFVWEPGSTSIELPLPAEFDATRFVDAFLINDAGVILGSSAADGDFNVDQRGLLWVPDRCGVTPDAGPPDDTGGDAGPTEPPSEGGPMVPPEEPTE
ncbi:MAG: hypothetical protein HYV09_25300 [Deltaproteobacteria bacterium]|nr:hypothetical protein [Deltaproteobacteria bacterium]